MASRIPLVLNAGQVEQLQSGDTLEGILSGVPALLWRGEWDSETEYVANDVVSNDGSSYICILANDNQEPPNETYWSVLGGGGEEGEEWTTDNITSTGGYWYDYGQIASGQSWLLSSCTLGDGIIVVGAGGNGVIFRSIDNGITWTNLGKPGNANDVYGICNLGDGIVLACAGTSTGRIYRSINHGETWSDLGQMYSADRVASLCNLGNGIVLAGTGTSVGKILRSENYGETWSDIGQQYSAVNIPSICNLGNGVAVAGTNVNGRVLRTIDYGLTWSEIGQLGSATVAHTFCFCGDGIVLAGTNGAIFRSENYGVTWDLAFELTDQTLVHSLVYCGNGTVFCGSESGGCIWRSGDFGLTWHSTTKLYSQICIRGISRFEDGALFAVTATGGRTLRSLSTSVGIKGEPGTPGPPGMTWCGAWDAETEYAVSDAVSNAGSSYICIEVHSNQEPPNETYWSLLCDASGAVVEEHESTYNHTNYNTAYAWGNHAGLYDASGAAASAVAAHELNYDHEITTLGDTSYYVATTGSDETGDGSSGNPWATLAKAISIISAEIFASDAVVSINMAAGVYSRSTVQYLNKCTPATVKIIGATPLERNVTSVQSSSGSAHNWTYVLNMDSVSGISVGDFLLLASGVSGGTLGKCLQGCWRITDVDALNNRVTVFVTSSWATAASGAVSFPGFILKTVLEWTSNSGLQLDGGVWEFDGVVLYGSTTSTNSGICLYGDGSINVSNKSCINRWLFGMCIRSSAGGTRLRGCISGCGSGIYSETSHQLLGVYSPLISGCGHGVDLVNSSMSNGALIVNCCLYGLHLDCNSSMKLHSLYEISYCTTGVYACYGSFVSGASGVVFSDNTADTNPVLDTEGNVRAFIAS